MTGGNHGAPRLHLLARGWTTTGEVEEKTGGVAAREGGVGTAYGGDADQAKGQHGHGAATWKREGGVRKAVRRTDDGLGAD